MTTAISKSEHTFASILQTAFDLAAMEGIGKLSLGEVAKCLGMSKSGVFSRVGSLKALQEAVLAEFDRRFSAEVFAPAMSLPRGLPRLYMIVERWIARACNKQCAFACLYYIAGSFEFDDIEMPLRDRLREGVARSRACLRRTVVQAIDEGHLRTDTDPDQLVFEIYSLIVGATHDTRFLGEAKAEERVRNAFARLITGYTRFRFSA
jgi:AcrR family transcriptional regulator